MTQQQERICILGGGFGGLYAALKLSQFPWTPGQKPEILLVDRHDRFLFSPLLYELVTGELQTWEIAPPFVELLAGTGVRFTQASVKDIDFEGKTVHLDDRPEISYTRLVLALGGETPMEIVPGAAEYALPFRTVRDAYRLQETLGAIESDHRDKIRVALVGAGYSGVELGCKIADRLGERGRLRLIDRHDTILRTSTEFNREAADKALEERGIWKDLETTVESIEADRIFLKYKEQVDELPVDLVLWTVGNQVADVIRNLAAAGSPLKQNERGQVVTTPTLQAVDNLDIFALGDLADCQDASGQTVPATAQVAFQQADYVAWNIWASLSDRPLLPFRYFNFGEMMTLGAENATLTGLGIKLDGSLAHVARRLAYLYRLPTLEHQMKVGLNWISEPFREFLGI